MTVKAPNGRTVTTDPRIEGFYTQLMAAATTSGINDLELVAVLSVVIGRFIDVHQKEKDAFIDTVLGNLKRGRADTARLQAALTTEH